MSRLGPLSFYKQALAVALPVILQAFLLNLVSLIDSFMVAGLGDIKMAGVNVANQINFVFMVLMGTVAGAGGIFLAQYKGADSTHGMQQAYRFKLVFSLGFAVLYFFMCQLIPETLVGFMIQGNSARDAIIREGANYLRVVSWSLLPMAWVSAAASSTRDIGKPKPALVFSLIAALVNTGLNFLLIEGQLGAPRLEVTGAAIATIVARCVELALLMAFLLRTKPGFLIRIANLLRFDRGIIIAILKRSWMMLVSEITWVLSETIVSAVYNGRGGADLVAGLASGWTIANLFFAIFGGLFVTASVMIGSELGADRKDSARDRARWMLNGSWFLGIFAGLIQVSTVLLIPLVFSNLSTEAREVSVQILLVIAGYMPIWVYINSQFAISRAGGDVLLGFVVDMIVNIGIFIPLVFILAALTPWSAVLLFALVKLSDLVKIAIGAWWLKKERWVKNLTVEVS